MKIEIRYDDHTKYFDTDQFVEESPFSGIDVLTLYELHYEEIATQGIWLSCHCFDLKRTVEATTCAGSWPVAKISSGWQMLLASRDQIGHILSMTVEGRLVLARCRGRLVNVATLEAKSISLDGQINQLADLLCREDPSLYADQARLAAEMGVPEDLISEVLEARLIQVTPDGEAINKDR
ncbi:MAG: hypothetical protein Q4D23_09940 [Bacteroidales bacterium]|nr:hypothetical protein [Bacteroidales bacterium]